PIPQHESFGLARHRCHDAVTGPLRDRVCGRLPSTHAVGGRGRFADLDLLDADEVETAHLAAPDVDPSTLDGQEVRFHWISGDATERERCAFPERNVRVRSDAVHT